MGRHSKLTPETQESIVEAIKLGATYELAAQAGGICYDTFNEWMKAGREATRKNKFSAFSEAIKEAEGAAAKKWLKHIEEAAEDLNWQAAAWKLERRYPNDYGRQVHQHQGPDGKEIPIKIIKGVSLDDL